MTAQGKKALILVSDFGVEEPELLRPVEDLKKAGIDVTVASDSGDTVQTVTGDKDWASTFAPDTSSSTSSVFFSFCAMLSSSSELRVDVG